jgi:hypothetical protein
VNGARVSLSTQAALVANKATLGYAVLSIRPHCRSSSVHRDISATLAPHHYATYTHYAATRTLTSKRIGTMVSNFRCVMRSMFVTAAWAKWEFGTYVGCVSRPRMRVCPQPTRSTRPIIYIPVRG